MIFLLTACSNIPAMSKERASILIDKSDVCRSMTYDKSQGYYSEEASEWIFPAVENGEENCKGTCTINTKTSDVQGRTSCEVFEGDNCTTEDGQCEARMIVGGPCSYEDYPGICTITSIQQTEDSKQQAETAGYEGYEVGYTFGLDEQPIKDPELLEKYKYYYEGELALNMVNGYYLGKQFLDKYKITTGAVFDCTFSIEKQGTCTPADISFKDIDTADYFELKK